MELNRAAALAMRDGPEVGLEVMDKLMKNKDLVGYHRLHAARADLFRRLDQTRQATHCYQQALALVQQEPERRFLQRRLAALEN